MSFKLQVIKGIVQNRTMNENKIEDLLAVAKFGLGIDAKMAWMVASGFNIRYPPQLNKKPLPVKIRQRF